MFASWNPDVEKTSPSFLRGTRSACRRKDTDSASSSVAGPREGDGDLRDLRWGSNRMSGATKNGGFQADMWNYEPKISLSMDWLKGKF